MLSMIFLPALTSCQSCRTEDKEITESISVTFPQPYDVNGNLIVTLDAETETVSMPLWYWTKIVEYAVWTSDSEGVENE